MTITYKKLFEPSQLTTSLATIFTVDTGLPAGSFLRGARVRLVNTTGTAVSAELDAVPLGLSAGATNMLFPTNKTVPANDYIDVDLPTMKPGDFLQAKAGAGSAITIHFISGGYFSS